MGKLNSCHIRMVKTFPSHVGDGTGEGTERPVKSKEH